MATVQGKEYDHVSAEFHIAGGLVTGVKELKWTQARTVGKAWGNSIAMRGRGRGKYEATATLTLYQKDWFDLIAALGEGYLEAEFNATVTYGLDNETLHKVELVKVTFTNDEGGSTEGEDLNEEALELDVQYVLIDGIAPVKGLQL